METSNLDKSNDITISNTDIIDINEHICCLIVDRQKLKDDNFIEQVTITLRDKKHKTRLRVIVNKIDEVENEYFNAIKDCLATLAVDYNKEKVLLGLN